MSLVFINGNAGQYQALSSDITAGSTIPGISYIGADVYITDTKTWYRVLPDLTLIPASTGAVALAPGESHLGNVGGITVTVTASPVLTVASAYITGDYIGTSSSPITFNNVARIAGGTGEIRAIMYDFAKQSIQTELWLFNDTLTTPADSAAWSISDADSLKCIGVFSFNTWYASSLNSICLSDDIIPFKCLNSTSNLYGCLVTRGTPSYASGDVTIKLTISQD
jgi:hypothetical protein